MSERARLIMAFSGLAKGLAKFGASEIRQPVELVGIVGELAFLTEGTQTKDVKLAHFGLRKTAGFLKAV